jgi:ribosomal protein S12 methylthiotransferase accessory factor
MAEKIRFKRCFCYERSDPDKVILFSEEDRILLKGRPYYLLAPLLERGEFSKEELAQQLEDKITSAQVYYALERLGKRGYIESSENPFTDEIAAFFALLGVNQREAFTKLNETKLSIHVLSQNVEKSKIISSLLPFPIQIVDDPASANLALVITDNYLDPRLKAFNHTAYQQRLPWLIIKPVGAKTWIGPLFIPEQTGCWECLSFCLEKNQAEESYVRQKKENHPVFTCSLRSSIDFCVSWTATELIKKILVSSSKLDGKVFSFDLISSCIEEHTLIKRPQCTCCGLKFYQEKMPPVELTSRKKTGDNEKRWRISTLDETWKRLAVHVSPITGIVPSLTRLMDEKALTPLHVYAAGKNNSFMREILGIKGKNFRIPSSGKGKSDLQAKVSGLCEALERYSGTHQGDEPFITSSFRALSRQAIHPKEFLLFSDKQYQERDSQNPLAIRMNQIPVPLPDDLEIDWTYAWSLTQGCYKYVPLSHCYYDMGVPFCYANSNGNGAGNCLEEAILHGFLELVERDAVAIWWYNRIQREAIDLMEQNDPYIESLIKEYERRGREFWVLDVTSDLKIPTFVAISQVKENGPKKIIFGSGAHFDPKIALTRALTEMHQLLAHQIETENIVYEISMRDRQNHPRKQELAWYNDETLETQPYLAKPETSAHKSISSFEPMGTIDLKDDILLSVEILKKQNLELLFVNLTRPEIDLSVVKVIVPGLRHWGPRFAPGRLYDVPVKMGWKKVALNESEMNPFPIVN